MRDYPEPDRLPGESNWEWCQRYAASIPAESLMEALVEYLDNRRSSKARRKRETWSIIGDITLHGSGVSTAIAERFRKKEQSE